MPLSKVPERLFETLGVCFGLSVSALIAVQIHAEWISRTPSSLSPIFLGGFLVSYLFWFLYGVRFRRFAVWFANLIAVFLQIVLLVVVARRGTM